MKGRQGYAEAELRKAVNRAIKKTIALAKMEPTVVLIAGALRGSAEKLSGPQEE